MISVSRHLKEIPKVLWSGCADDAPCKCQSKRSILFIDVHALSFSFSNPISIDLGHNSSFEKMPLRMIFSFMCDVCVTVGVSEENGLKLMEQNFVFFNTSVVKLFLIFYLDRCALFLSVLFTLRTSLFVPMFLKQSVHQLLWIMIIMRFHVTISDTVITYQLLLEKDINNTN